MKVKTYLIIISDSMAYKWIYKRIFFIIVILENSRIIFSVANTKKADV